MGRRGFKKSRPYSYSPFTAGQVWSHQDDKEVLDRVNRELTTIEKELRARGLEYQQVEYYQDTGSLVRVDTAWACGVG